MINDKHIQDLREKIDQVILAQPEHLTPLHQVERVQKIIDQIIKHIEEKMKVPCWM